MAATREMRFRCDHCSALAVLKKVPFPSVCLHYFQLSEGQINIIELEELQSGVTGNMMQLVRDTTAIKWMRI